MEDRRINWGQILVTAAVTGLVTVITGIVLFKIQTREPKLVYDVPDTSSFQGTNTNFAIYNVSVSNRGSASINNVTGIIQIPLATIDEIRVNSDPSLKLSTNIISDTLELQANELNSNDTITISILATSQDELPTSPKISIRGSGIIGVKSNQFDTSQITQKIWTYAILGIVYIGFLLILILIGRYVQRKGPISFSILGTRFTFPNSSNRGWFTDGKHVDDQNLILAYLCGKQGLVNEVREYLARQPNSTAYWAEADKFASLAILEPESNTSNKRKQVLIELLNYASISVLSESIIYYNIARIANAQGNLEEAKEFLSKAIIINEKFVWARLENEPLLRQIME